MRWLLLLLMAPTAVACTEAEPCLLRVHTDADGLYFGAPGDTNFAVEQGDWYVLDVWNGHPREHELFLEHYGLKIDAAPFGANPEPTTRSDPVRFTDDGSFTLRDEDSRKEATITVRPDPAFSHNASKVEPTPATATSTTSTTTRPPVAEPEQDRVRSVPLPLLAPVVGLVLAARWRR